MSQSRQGFAPSEGAPMPPQGAPMPPQGVPMAPQGTPLPSQGAQMPPQAMPTAPQGAPTVVEPPQSQQVPAYGPASYSGQPPQSQPAPTYDPASYSGQPAYQPGPTAVPPRKPVAQQSYADNDNPSDPTHYIRNPHKLIAYLIPFPKPLLVPGVDPSTVPTRAPSENEKEAKLHKVQRKWQEEVRSAKASTAKTASWKGVKSKATRGINWAMTQTTSSNLDFLGRMPSSTQSDSENDSEGETTKKTVPVEEIMREEFVNTMLRTKSKAQRDTVISTGLLPVAWGIDIVSSVVWPFGGLGEIDTLWAYTSWRGLKTSRSVTKRLSSASNHENPRNDKEIDNQLKLNFIQSQRLEILSRYLGAECGKIEPTMFPEHIYSPPTEEQVLEAIGWSPSQTGETKNWEDEQWEVSETKDDLKTAFRKAAKEWKKWCSQLEKHPEKATKK
ncbi:hypothetical protein LTR70_005022 [Exophiala xenobiotica]|uniref:Uncharacterized protein n=1 Tax=Lithohypha guttulata TaxID=1690604 RepID=A0ABR0JVK2_9EURO|nr:hypothetical protein LTR24_010017 [Lithohypha guttulata]KAK5319269.1 hypothetical protein LTR70_005022 [Exophiala xenobiotica]